MAWIVTAAVVSVGSTVYTQKQEQKRADDVVEEQERARKTDQAIANEKASRERRQQAQKAQQQNATIENMGAVSGMSGSSFITNAVATTNAQTAANVGYINSNQAYGKIQRSDQQRILDAQNAGPGTDEMIVGAIGSLFGSAASGAASQAGANAAK